MRPHVRYVRPPRGRGARGATSDNKSPIRERVVWCRAACATVTNGHVTKLSSELFSIGVRKTGTLIPRTSRVTYIVYKRIFKPYLDAMTISTARPNVVPQSAAEGAQNLSYPGDVPPGPRSRLWRAARQCVQAAHVLQISFRARLRPDNL